VVGGIGAGAGNTVGDGSAKLGVADAEAGGGRIPSLAGGVNACATTRDPNASITPIANSTRPMFQPSARIFTASRIGSQPATEGRVVPNDVRSCNTSAIDDGAGRMQRRSIREFLAESILLAPRR
jgi:hypothetical protein